MRKKIYKTIIIALLSIITLTMTSTVYAESEYDEYEDIKNGNSTDIGDYDWTEEEEQTQTFYRKKSTFQSSYDYEIYCEEMYKLGYMTKNHEWTSAAKDYINNMTQETFEALDIDAKEVINQRIEDGELAPEDNPYLTYDERQELIKEKEEENNNQSDVNESENNEGAETEDNTDTDIVEEENKENEEDNKNEQEKVETEEAKEEEKTSGNTINRVMMVIFAAVIILGAYYIYKKQFVV